LGIGPSKKDNIFGVQEVDCSLEGFKESLLFGLFILKFHPLMGSFLGRKEGSTRLPKGLKR